MSQCYDMNVEITGFNPAQTGAIIEAANQEWDGFTGSWQEDSCYLTASGEGSLYGGETDEAFAARLTGAIWTANGAFCHVTVTTTFLENLPSDSYILSEDDYTKFLASQVPACHAS